MVDRGLHHTIILLGAPCTIDHQTHSSKAVAGCHDVLPHLRTQLEVLLYRILQRVVLLVVDAELAIRIIQGYVSHFYAVAHVGGLLVDHKMQP